MLGAAVSAGWVLHDLGVFATCGEPPLALEILPGSLLVVLGGALFGWAVSSRRWGRWALPAALLAAAAASVLPRPMGLPFSLAQFWLPRAIFTCLAGFAAALLLGRRLRVSGGGLARLGLLAGVLGAVAIGLYRGSKHAPSWPVLLGVLGAAAAGAIPRPSTRRLATTLVAILAASSLGWKATRQLSPSRDDLAPPANAAPSEAHHLLLVVLDTLRADHLSPYGYERITTPGLDDYVGKHFTRYQNARSTSSWTLPSHASLLTGLYPAEHGCAHPGVVAQPLRKDVRTLAEVLRDAGYQTAAIAANDVYLRPQFGIDRGFEHFDDRLGGAVRNYLCFAQLLGFHLRAGQLSYRDAETITDLATDWLDERREGPFFLMLNYMDVHTPNLPASPFDRAFGEGQPRDPLQPGRELAALLYDRELLYLDHHLTRLLRALEERGLFDATSIIITSDHGEGLGDHGMQRHGGGLYESLVRVPLYLKPAGVRTETVVADDVTGADVFFLALRHAGIPTEPRRKDGFVGEWYVNPDRRPAAKRVGVGLDFDLVCWVTGRTKTIVARDGFVEAYDLERDPWEQSPLELSPAEAEQARARAQDWWRAHPIEAAPLALDREALDRMRALGYLGDDE